MLEWTPIDFGLAMTISACGVVLVVIVLLLLVQPAITIGDWIDMKMKLWWKGNGNTNKDS